METCSGELMVIWRWFNGYLTGIQWIRGLAPPKVDAKNLERSGNYEEEIRKKLSTVLEHLVYVVYCLMMVYLAYVMKTVGYDIPFKTSSNSGYLLSIQDS